jgi:hypothetical protein
MSDTLTILTSLDGPCTKSFQLHNREVISRDNKKPFKFDVREQAINGLDDLSRALSALETDSQVAIIRGKSVDELPVFDVRRRNENFQVEPRQWCLIDIDDLHIPKGLEDFKGHLPELVKVSIRQLPPEFQNVECWYQFSSSMGIKQGKIRIHLWFWLSCKVSDGEMKTWLDGSLADLRLFHPVQMHYVAKPIFVGNAVDPLPVRSGRYTADDGSSTVNVPDDLVGRTLSRSTRPRYVREGGHVESQDVIRNPDTWLVIDGRERLLFDLSNEVTVELVRASRKGKLPTVEEITDRLWERFSKEADLSDDKWTVIEAGSKAAARHDELVNETFPFSARGSGNILLPTNGPYFHLDLVSKEEGQQRLDGCLTDFFNSLEDHDTPRQVVKITMGAGKTTQTIEHLKSYLQSQADKLVEIYVPRHDIADEYEERLAKSPAVSARIIHIYPRTGGRMDTETGETQFTPLCVRADYVRSLEKAGHSVYRSACQGEEGEICEHFSNCDYLNQFRPSLTSYQNRNIIRIYQHAQLGLPRNTFEDGQKPDLVIIDEGFLPSLLDNDRSTTLEALRQYLKAPDHPLLGGVVADALQDSKPVLNALRDAGVQRSDLIRINLDAFASGSSFDGSRVSTTTLSDTSEYRALRSVIQIIREEWALADRGNVGRITYDQDNAAVKISLLKDARIPENAALLMLDATADKDLVEKVVGPVRFDQIDIQQKAVVTQVYDHSGSNAWWNDNPGQIDDLVLVLNEWVNYGETPLCVSHKSLAEALRARADLSDSVKILNFSGLRGSNDAEDCSVVFITGRNQLPPPAVAAKARAVFWDEGALKYEDMSSDLPRELRGYLMSERYQGKQSGVQVRAFADPRIEKLHAQEREAETVQAIARLRLVHSRYVKRVFLLGNLPIETPVDRLVTLDELMPDRLEKELLDKRNLPITALGIIKMRPDITENNDTAKKMLRRSSVTDIRTLAAVLPDLASATILITTFKAGDGRRTEHKHLFLLEPACAEHDVVVGSIPSKLEIKEILVEGWGQVEDLEIGFWGGLELSTKGTGLYKYL